MKVHWCCKLYFHNRAAAVVLGCVADRITNITQNACTKLTIARIYGSSKCLLPHEHPGSKWENKVAFATIATTNFEPCVRGEGRALHACVIHTSVQCTQSDQHTMHTVLVECGSSVVECRTRNQVSPCSNPPLLPCRRLSIFVLSIDAPVHSAV